MLLQPSFSRVGNQPIASRCVGGQSKKRRHNFSTLWSVRYGTVESTTRNTIAAAASSPTKTESQAWWKEYSGLWQDVTSRGEFEAHISDTNYDIIFVDWYATWCHGCQRAFPELSRMAASDSLRTQVKFVKVGVDNMKALAKEYGVKVLPQVTLFRPGYGKLLHFQAVPSKLKVARQNIDTMLQNPEKFFKLDPNGYVVAVDEDPTPEENKAKEEAKKLKASTGSLFEKLMAASSAPSSSNGTNTSDSASEAAPSARPAADCPSSTPAPSPPASPATQAQTKDEQLAHAKAEFLKKWQSSYGYGGRIDDLYQHEIGHRMSPNEHYLDYTGSSLYCTSVLRDIFADLQSNVYGNPHSDNPSSSLTSERIEEARDLVLRFFNASPADYQVVFTKSATGALQITGESFPWQAGSVFRYTRENHNSVLGIREYALQHGSRFQAVESDWVESWISGHKEDDHFLHPEPGTPDDPIYSLFAFPAEDNFAGKKYPLRWIKEIQSMSTPGNQWKVLLDAAAFAPTQPLDLTEFPADFVCISFYKMFGFPTGLGALLVRTENIDLMKKVFWGGGTVALATSSDNFHVLKCRPSDKFEDGTVAFLDIVALRHVFSFADSLGGVPAIQAHVHSLTRHFYSRLSSMRHSNGRPLTAVFGHHDHPAPDQVQGGILNFEVLDPESVPFSYRTVEVEAAASGFHIRTGILCNPGAAYREVGISEEEVETLAGEKEGCGDEIDFIEVKRPVSDSGIISDEDIMPVMKAGNMQLGHPGEVAMKWVKKPLGSVRASLGYMSTFEDVESFCMFLKDKYTDRSAFSA